MDPLDIPLRDIHLPEPIGIWPPAIGWWILIALGGLATVSLVVWLWNRRVTRHRRLCLKQLAIIETNFTEHNDPHKLARELSMLARQSVMSEPTTCQVSGVVGENWARGWLDQFDPGDIDKELLIYFLTIAPYRKTANEHTTSQTEATAGSERNSRSATEAIQQIRKVFETITPSKIDQLHATFISDNKSTQDAASESAVTAS